MFRQIIVFTKSPQLPSVKGLVDASQTLEFFIQTLNPFMEIFWPLGEGPKLPERLRMPENDLWSDTLVMVRTSGILFDDIDLTLAKEFEERGARLHIPIPALRIFRDKSAQAQWLHTQGIPGVKSLVLRGQLNPTEFETWDSSSEEFIVKSIRGNKGIGVKKFSRSDLSKFWEQTSNSFDQRYIIQPFLKEALEVRHLILGDEHFFIQKNPPKDPNEFRKNSAYSEFTPSILEEKELEELTHQGKLLQKKLKSPSFALDLMKVDGSWKILEMNANPGLRQASKVFPQENLFEKYLRSYLNPY